MYAQMHLAQGMIQGRLHREHDYVQARELELARADARRARRRTRTR